jgi:methyl-accepting chemotaxis protein
MVTSTLLSLIQAVPARDTLSVAADVSGIVIAAAIFVLVVLAGMLILRVNRLIGDVRTGLHHNLGPVSDRARGISDNVEFITQALRTDVEKLNGSVTALTERLHHASERMEERIEEFNALMEVVQGEAEELFIETASTVRGVREGARTITDSRSAPEAVERSVEGAED